MPTPPLKQRKNIGQGGLKYERLEPRQLLAADFQITEFLAANSNGLLDDNSETSDWIEIYNAGTSTGNLNGFTLTDDASQPDKYTLPSRNLAPGQFLIVFANTDATPATGIFLYTDFRLSAGGEYLGLFDPAGNVVSEFGVNGSDYPAQSDDVSYGVEFSGSNISSSGNVGFFNTPTPGQPNGTLSNGPTAQVEASISAGFYENAFQVTLSSDTPNATIRYTTDGSTPSATNGLFYTGPINVSETTNLRAVATRANFDTSPSETWSYIFLDDVLEQSNNGEIPAGFPDDFGGNVFDYGIDPQVIAIEGEDVVRNALQAIPSFSITTDLDNLFDPNTGIYTNPLQDGREWERPASVELLNPDGSEGFQVNAGLRIRGGFSRLPQNPKHSFRLFFRGEYGDSELAYPLFGDSGVDAFEKIDLRTAQNYSWSREGAADNNFIVDQFARESQLALGQPSTRSSWLHLYINGEYWGLYQTQERADADYAASYLGGDADNYDVIKPDAGPGRPYTNEATDGDLNAYDALAQQAQARAADGVTPAFVDNAAYYRAQGLNPDGTPNPNFDTLLDVDNLIDYNLLILHGGNFDAPISNFLQNNRINNYIAIRDRTGNEGFHFHIHDSEHSYKSLNENRNGPYNHSNFDSGVSHFNPQWLHQQLMANAEYRTAFADRVQEVFFNDGPLSTESNLARWDLLASQIDQAIIGESARWGDAQRNFPRLRTDWLATVQDVRNNIIAQRNDVLLNQLQNTVLQLKDSPFSSSYNRTVSAPLFSSIDAPNFLVDGEAQHGGVVDAGSDLQLSSNGGTIYFTTDGSDPREVGGSINPTAEIFDATSTTTTLINTGSSWNYLDTGANLNGVAWQDPNFNDSAWATGNGEFGFGDGTETTTIDFGGDPNNKHITTYFRKDFFAGNFDFATLRVRRDDGIAIYINGTEVGRDNLPVGPIGYQTTSLTFLDGPEETEFIEFNIPGSLLVAGLNTIAVEVHQSSGTSSDLRFDAQLTGTLLANNAGAVTLNETTPVLSRVRASDGTWSPLQSTVFFVAGDAPSTSNLRISEVNYNPALGGAEFIELQNINPAGGAAVDLSGVTLTDGPSVPLTFAEGTSLAAGEFGLLVRDVTAFTAAYPNVDPALILGEYEGGLSNSGEAITLVAPDSSVIADFTYNDSDPFPFAADGQGFSLVLDDAVNTPANELGKYYSWRTSTELGGSPGAASAVPTGVVINEILANSEDALSDTIELFNPTGSAIDVGGFFLSDAASDLLKYQIPNGTVISAGGYLVFDESDFNATATGFALSGSAGDQVYLSQASGGAFIGLQDSVQFSATFSGESLGRLPDGTGRLTRLASTSFGSANGNAEVGPLVVSEINYHPEDPSAAALAIDSALTDNDLEYIEIANPTSAAIDLTNWRLRGEADYDFAAGTSLAAGEAIVVVSFDPSDLANLLKTAAFRAHYNISNGVTLVGGFTGSLSNSSGRISLQQPDTPDALGIIPHVVVDEVVYDDLAPWGDADGSGLTLERDALAANGSLADSWIAAVPTPGTFEDDFLLGDASLNSIVDFGDIAPFIAILQAGDYLDEADINRDGVVDFADIPFFIELLQAQ